MPPSRTPPLAIVSTTYSPDPRQAMSLARTANFKAIQFDARSASLDLTDLSQSGRREFRQILASNELELVGPRASTGPKGLAASADIDQILSRLNKVFESAASLQAPLVCLDLGPLPEPARTVKPKPKIDPAQAGLIILPGSTSFLDDPANAPEPEESRPADSAFEAAVDAALIALGALADRYSVIVAMRSELASHAAIQRALHAANCPWFGIDLDPAAALRDRWNLEKIFDQLASQIRHVRGRDARAGHDRRTQPTPLGAGDTNWEQLLALLADAAYRGWITVDPLELSDRPGAARSAREHLISFSE